MQPDPHTNRSSPAQFRSKLTTYLSGVLIGFLMLGSIYFFKHLAVEQEKQANEAKQAQTTSLPDTAPNDQQTPPAKQSGSPEQTGSTP